MTNDEKKNVRDLTPEMADIYLAIISLTVLLSRKIEITTSSVHLLMNCDKRLL